MNQIVTKVSTQHPALSTQHSPLIPLPELPITVRLATMEDIPFIDGLQKKNNKSLGFMPQKALEGKIRLEEVLIAEERRGQKSEVRDQISEIDSSLTSDLRPLTSSSTRVGYLIGNDLYFKHDDIGIVYQLCVVPDKRRGLVAATLLKSLFERASYGCKLYCCWCAKDLDANYFWESMGFVPVAFRTGAKKKVKDKNGNSVDRVHIFWQKRIRAGDTTTPYWYPHETGGGAIGEDRIVLPIPPHVHWSEVESVVVPGEEERDQSSEVRGQTDENLISDLRPLTSSESNAEIRTPDAAGGEDSPHREDARPSRPKRARKSNQHSAPSTGERNAHGQHSKKEPYTLRCQAIYFAPPVVEKPKAEKVKKEKPQKEKKKNDPEKVKAARYIRDVYTEEINRGDYLVSNGKYDVTRLVENAPVPLKGITGGVPSVAPDQKLLAA